MRRLAATIVDHGRPWLHVLIDEADNRILECAVAARVKNTGDGLLMTFTTPSEAVACAAELVRELRGVGLTVRAGLHAGEIVVREDGDVTGLAVNLAARVQQAASGGATWVSSTVRDLLLGGEWSFTERGEHVLKGIDGAWRLYELAA